VLLLAACSSSSSDGPANTGGAAGGGAGGAAGGTAGEAGVDAGVGGQGGAAGSTADAGDSGTFCQPGVKIACGCPEAAVGIQVCAADGAAYGQCDCTATVQLVGSCAKPLVIYAPVSDGGVTNRFESEPWPLSQASSHGGYPFACKSNLAALEAIGQFTAPGDGTWSFDATVTSPGTGPRAVLGSSTCPLDPSQGACNGAFGLAMKSGDVSFVRVDFPADATGTVVLAATLISP